MQPRDTPVRGVVRPVDQAAISSELAARITELPRKEGQSFRKGDLLAAFDCRRHQAEAQAAEAAFREARIAHESQVYLQRNQAGSRYDSETAKARADKAGAEAASLAVRLDQCRVNAPFNGRIAELGVYVHETPAPGKPFLTIIDDSALEVELIVPSAWLGWLKQGTAFAFAVDETGGSYSSHIARIGAAVDPVSQTIKVVGTLDSPDGRVMAGMSGSASFASGL
ncbi:efflux RND transporter periplasmic adaptor subunit [Bosea beijingensis]|uniref:efflux RND transporter periplasmic adaptor subunit n=1 Tax=Bosea beijingensis TaxID=3068632 RepID=UPI003BEED6DD